MGSRSKPTVTSGRHRARDARLNAPEVLDMPISHTTSPAGPTRPIMLFALAIGAFVPSARAQSAASPRDTPGRSYDPHLPNVVVLETDIPSNDSARGPKLRYAGEALGAKSLVAALPHASTLANLRGERIVSVDSQRTDDAILVGLATRVDELLAMPDVSGVVVARGRGTIEQTAYFLALVVKSDKPVVVTAASRSAEQFPPSAARNLYDAVAVAASERAYGRGVLVVLDGAVAWSAAPVGKHGARSEFSVEDTTTLPRVDIVIATPSMDGAPIDAAAAAGAKGIVIAGIGNGTIPDAALDALARAATKGIVCVRSARVAGTRVDRNVGADDDRLGLVASLALDPERARVLLRVALLETSDPRRVQQYFADY